MRSAGPTRSRCARRGSSSSSCAGCSTTSRRRRVAGRVLRRPAGAPRRRGRGARAVVDGVRLGALVGRRLVDGEEARRRRLLFVREQAHAESARWESGRVCRGRERGEGEEEEEEEGERRASCEVSRPRAIRLSSRACVGLCSARASSSRPVSRSCAAQPPSSQRRNWGKPISTT